MLIFMELVKSTAKNYNTRFMVYFAQYIAAWYIKYAIYITGSLHPIEICFFS